MSTNKKLVIKSTDRQLVYGEVYAPMDVDTHGEFMTAEGVEQMAHDFLASGRVDKIDVQHDQNPSGSYVVESYIAKQGDPDGFVEGAWVLGVKVEDPELWSKVKKGELNCFSFMGPTARVQIDAQMKIATSLSGRTETNTDEVIPPHDHPVEISFDQDGHIVEAKIGKAQDHSHAIKSLSSTEEAVGHSHRMIIEKE